MNKTTPCQANDDNPKENGNHFVASIFIIALARIGCNGFVPSYESYVINGKSGGYHGL